MRPAELDVADPAAMRRLGARIGAVVRSGDLVVLSGPLGAGKTVLVQGLAAGLGVTTPVTSPTFVIARVHRDGRIPLVHVDAYRLGGLAEVDDLDLDSDVADAVTVVEWGSGLVERLADSHLLVEIAPAADSDVRQVRLVGHGSRWTGDELTTLASDAPG